MRSKAPTFWHEQRAFKRGYEQVVGVDEVGRGAWAGPVVAGACAIYNSQVTIFKNLGIDDSKKLTAKKREELDKIIRRHAKWGIGEVGAATIDRVGIVKATEKAMRMAVAKIRRGKTFVSVDAFHVKYIPGVGLKNQKAIIRGDQKSLLIAAASIIAKVYRDGLMTKIKNKYGWKRNKGYGTATHQAAIKKYGLTRWHRQSYIHQ